MIGSKLSNRYEIVAELGRGGMGVVYRAHDPLLKREVAVKLIPPTMLSPSTEQRFQNEAQLVAQMDHPAIVQIYDFGNHEGSLFFVMPIVQGTTLSSLLRENSLSFGDVIDMGIQVAEALEYSHARNVVHRDIKPENIMLLRDEGDGVRARVMDFGLARVITEDRLTKTGAIIGTPSYLSPEQVSAKQIDSRSDIYSLGVMLYECVVGQPPFTGDMQSLLYRIVHEIPQPPRALGAAIDEQLESAILACLAKEPGRRPQRASEIAESLKRYRSKLHASDRNLPLAATRTIIMEKRPALPTFVGREKELAELQQRLNAAIAGECQFVIVAGETGIGKTRLLDEIEKLAKARGIRVLHGRFVEQDRSFPYQGFCEAIQEYFRQKETSVSSSSSSDFSDLAGELVALFPMLNEVSDIRQAAIAERKLDRPGDTQGAESRTAVFELLARTLARIAGGKPLVLVMEELHGADVSIEALQYIVRRLGPTPTLIVGTYRSTEIDRHHPLAAMLNSFRGDRHFTSLSLGSLTPSEHRSYLQTLVGGETEIEGSLAGKLFEVTEGNPFFTKEIMRSLLDSGGITKNQTGAWSLSGEAEISTGALPVTIQQAVEKRIERLPDDLREALSIAAVIGKSFDARDLETLVEEKGDVEDAIDRLIQEGLIEEERESRGDRLTFSSGVVRDVLYAELSRRKRRSLHRKYVEQLESRHGGRLERIYPQLVYHYSQGDVPEKTVEYALKLAHTSLDAFSAEEAVRSVKTALQFLDDEWEGEKSVEGEARMLLARAFRMTGDIDGALRESEAAIKIFEREKQTPRGARALLLAAETAWQARRTEDAIKWIERGMSAARAANEIDTLRQMLSLAATLANLRSEYEKANEYLEEAARLGSASKEADAEEEIPPGGKLVVGLTNPVNTLEPAAHELVEEAEILTNVFETLLATDEEGNLVPSLCERWEAKDEGRSFFLTLRADVSFQDGQPLTAEGVKKSFERAIRSLPGKMPSVFAAIRGVSAFAEKTTDDIAGIVVHSDNKLEFQLSESLPVYPALLADHHTAITRASGNGDARVYGTGPFRIASHERDRIILERHPEYWKRTPAKLDAIEFRPNLSAATIASGVRSGELDLARELLPQDLDEILRDARFRRGLVEAPMKNTYLIVFNSSTSSVLRDQAMRRALAGVVRTHDLVWQTLGRFAQPTACLIPPGLLGHDPGRRRRPLTREEALAMMMRSPETIEPINLRAAVHPILQDRYASLLTALFSVWSEIGVKVSVETPDMASYLEAQRNAEKLDLLIGRWAADYDDPDDFTYNLFHSRAGLYRTYTSSAEGDQILEEARAESRPKVRESLYRKFENLVLESGVVVPLFHDINYRVASPKVLGLKLQSNPPYVNYAALGKAESSSAAETPRAAGGLVQIPITGTVNSLDPSLASTVEQSEVIPSIFETLTHLAGGARIVPWLAAEFKVEGGGRRYRFRLRDDVRFHDGRKLTARDVRYSYERLLQNSDSSGRWLFSAIRGADALLNGDASDLAGFQIHSANEFVIELNEPVSFFPALISYPGAAIVPEGSDPSGKSWHEGCVGTGPFRVVRFDAGRLLELERNQLYWRKGYPKSERLIFNFGVAPQDILAEFRAGRFSLAADLFPADVEALLREPDFASHYRETPRLITYYVAFNSHRGPLSDKSLRQHLARSIDVAALVRNSLGRLAIPAHGLIPPGLLGHDAARASRIASPHSLAPPEQASAEIEATAVLNPIFFGEYSALTREIERAFGERRVKIRPVNTTLTEFLNVEIRSKVDLVVGRWLTDYPDANSFVHLLHSQEGMLGQTCSSPEIDRLIERGRAETSASARHALYREIEEIIARDALLIPLFHEQVYRFAQPEVEGLSVSYMPPTVSYENLRIRD